VRLLLALVALALLAPGGAHAAAPGLVTAIDQTVDEAQTAQRLRARWVRVYVNWHDLEPARGVVDPGLLAGYAARVRALDAAGVKTLVALSGTPGWARSAPVPYAAPRRARDYGRFAGRLAREIPGIDAWEIWNEADESWFWHGGPDARRYTRLMRAAYRSIKRVAPRDTVLTTGLVGNNRDFLAKIYRYGGRRYFDGVAVHTATACGTNHPGFFYREPTGRVGRYTFSGYREIRELMVRRGDRRKGIWMTEMGWNTAATGPRSCDIGAWKGKKAMGVSERVQARFLTDAFRCLAADRYVKAAFWFSTQDISRRKEFGQQLGLLRRDGSAKPAARAFKRAPRVRPMRCGGY
jgi:hypothetical protein